eukprot:CAMPEP_0114627116 /NCGR_PEP_ID=MMETSP0168-20121206/12133_1 /TAXON_ID=95228 ORGANISM="Vannella sp., Strain DIVA3 517/6/12" /NCGR_SAMPLE_ID=MMETSP0168 /ASSEMBLY_ACC=CAM_ASM_000044 /LENGTH=169 /DNA_ID=CAMNT_0001838445 /DNA_START=277 /DNA_END=783 /DNA_ORIENTATION=-
MILSSPSREEMLFEQEREEFFNSVQMPEDLFPTASAPRKRTHDYMRDDSPLRPVSPPGPMVTRESGLDAIIQGPSRKMRKMKHAEPSEKDLAIGDVVSLRFSDSMTDGQVESPTVLARVILKESFGVFVSVASESPLLPGVKRRSRYWARFFGDVALDGLYILDVVHEA